LKDTEYCPKQSGCGLYRVKKGYAVDVYMTLCQLDAKIYNKGYANWGESGAGPGRILRGHEALRIVTHRLTECSPFQRLELCEITPIRQYAANKMLRRCEWLAFGVVQKGKVNQ
jgi:hypothetical protein